MLQPFDVTKTENAVHKLMIQYLFMPSEDMKYEDAVSNKWYIIVQVSCYLY